MRSRYRVVTFAVVGSLATGMYAAGTFLFHRAGLIASTASALAYTVCVIFSYCGHRWLTFRSDRSHAEAIPRFIYVSLLGYAVSFVVPLVVTDWLHQSQLYSIAAICIIVPLLSYFCLDRLVYRRAASERNAGD